MHNAYKPSGKYVIYIKSTKDTARAKALLGTAMATRCRIIGEYIETSVRKNYKPELEKAIAKCNEKAATLIIANIGHLPRSLAFCNACMKLDTQDPYIIAVRSTDYRVDCFQYGVQQMFLQCIDQIEVNKQTAKNALQKKMKEFIDPNTNALWKAGNPVNLEVATQNATKARQIQADNYCKEIMPVIREIQRYGDVTLQGIANALMARNLKTRRNKDEWTPAGVRNILLKAKKLNI